MTKRIYSLFITFFVGIFCSGIFSATSTLANTTAATGNTTGTANTANTTTNATNTTNTTGTTTNTANTTNTTTPQIITLQPATQTTAAIPSMLDVNDEYTDILKKIDAKMDEIMSECSSLGLKKPEILTGRIVNTAQSATGTNAAGNANTTGTAASSTGGTSDSGSNTSTTNNEEIVFDLRK